MKKNILPFLMLPFFCCNNSAQSRIYSKAQKDSVLASSDSLVKQADSLLPNKETSQGLETRIKEEAKPAYVEAYKKISYLKMQLQSVANGDVRPETVIREYNEILGYEIGRLKTLKEIKAKLESSGDAYVKYKWMKRAAEIAREKAAEESFKVETLKNEP